MKSRFLFPHRFKLIGLLLFIPFTALGIITTLKEFKFNFLTFNIPPQLRFAGFYNHSNGDRITYVLNKVNFTNEFAFAGIIVSLFFIAFSKIKFEDEYISKVRLVSLQWSLYINYGILLIASYFFHGFVFLYLPLFNMFTPLVIFTLFFHFQIYVKPLISK